MGNKWSGKLESPFRAFVLYIIQHVIVDMTLGGNDVIRNLS